MGLYWFNTEGRGQAQASSFFGFLKPLFVTDFKCWFMHFI